MTAGELAEKLATVPAHHQVVLATDAEGNGFRVLADADPAHVTDTGHGAREVWLPEEPQPAPDNALVLWPV